MRGHARTHVRECPGGKAPRLDEFEHGLPSLPVPPLAATMRRWLQSLEPILDAAAMQRACASAVHILKSTLVSWLSIVNFLGH